MARARGAIKAAATALTALCALAAGMVLPAVALDPEVIEAGDVLALRLQQNDTLSGQYEVDHNGRLSLLTVGRLDVAGMPIAQAEAKVREAVAERLGLERPHLLLDFAARRPVTVVGDVEAAGEVPWRNGMVVIEAIAKAGGFARRDNENITIRLEHARIAERIERLRLGMAETMVAVARLDAEEAGSDGFDLPAEAEPYVGAATLRRIAADQKAMLERRRTSLADRRASLEVQLERALEERAALEAQLEATRVEESLLREEVNNLAGARGRGVIPETRFLALDRRVAEVTGDIAELIGRVARNGRERAQIERSIEAVDQDYLIEVREAANQARARRADLEREIEGALAQLGVADRLSSYIAMRERERERERTATGEISILRRADDGGWVTVVADLTTELLPGDVLQVPMSSGLTRPRVQTANRADESG